MINLRYARWTLTAVTSLLVGCAGSAEEGGQEGRVARQQSALTTTGDKSLMITAVSVVADATRTKDPCGAVSGDENKVWSIGHLLKREAEKNGLDPTTYATNWMNAWNSTVVINGDTVGPGRAPDVLAAWHNFAGNSTLPLYKAPFYLLAIVSRLDLRKHRAFGEPLGGEVRFIFGLLGASVNRPACPTQEYSADSTIIFEYSTNKTDDNQVRDLATRWLNLSTLSGSGYNSALQTLTEEVVNSGRLLKVRTNEFIDAQTRQRMTEFEPNATTKYLQHTALQQSAVMALANSTPGAMTDPLGTYMIANETNLAANAFDEELTSTATQLPIGNYLVPNKFPGTNTWFRGAVNTTGVDEASDVFDADPPNPDVAFGKARWQFSVGTCTGCHGADTQTFSFHVFPRDPLSGAPAFLSNFVNGTYTTAPDSQWPGLIPSRTINEMVRRENDLRNLVNGAPVLLPTFGNNYTVRFATGNKCLDSAGNNTTDGAVSQLYACHGNGNQRLSLVDLGGGVYNLKYKHSGKCIDVQNASTSSGARVVQMTCSSARNSQKLTLSTRSGVTPATRVLRFQHSGLCLLVQNQSTADGAAIIQGSCPASNDFAKGFNLVE